MVSPPAGVGVDGTSSPQWMGTIEATKPDLGEALGCVSVAEKSCYVVDGKNSTDSKNK